MSTEPQVELITEAEYWAGEEASATRHEYFNGHIRAMEAGSAPHTLICNNLTTAIKQALGDKPLDVRDDQQRLKVESIGLMTYADAVIFHLPARFEGETEHTLLSPQIIFEVLSESSREYDIGDKFRTYMMLKTLTDYVLIDQEHVEISHFHRTTEGWLLKTYLRLEDTLAFSDIKVELPIKAIYAQTGLPDGSLPLFDTLQGEN